MLDFHQIEAFYPVELRPFRKNILREYLQFKILDAVYGSAFGAKLAFMGGTCIHIVHGNPRFSEDLDFDNWNLLPEEFESLARHVATTLEREGYAVDLKATCRNAFRACVRFPGLLFTMGLSRHRAERLLIQIDTEPQHFIYTPDKPILNRFDVFARINVAPPDILLGQKLFCILNRKRPLGRDFFDAIFLMGKTKVNMAYINQKLGVANKEELLERVRARCGDLNFEQLATDVASLVYRVKCLLT